jgi:ComF family protein
MLRDPNFSSALRGAKGERWPSECAVCRSFGRGRLCEDCIARFAPRSVRCERCALPLPLAAPRCGPCLRDPPPFTWACAAVDYGHPWDGLVARFKFHAALDLAPLLARRMLEAHASMAHPLGQWLVPVPLSAERLRERGFNQSWELVRRLARRGRARADATLMRRTRDTAHQVDLAPARRSANVRPAFTVDPRRRHELRGQRITLVDDVMTTGATLSEAAWTLLLAGAQEVDVWVLARTPQKDEA